MRQRKAVFQDVNIKVKFNCNKIQVNERVERKSPPHCKKTQDDVSKYIP